MFLKCIKRQYVDVDDADVDGVDVTITLITVNINITIFVSMHIKNIILTSNVTLIIVNVSSSSIMLHLYVDLRTVLCLWAHIWSPANTMS